jgi:SAM-dependent methyltransferase
VSELPFALAAPLVPRLRAVVDIEGKIVRALDVLGPLAGRDVAFVDVPAGPLRDRLEREGITARFLPLSAPLTLDVPGGSLDAIVTLWSGFRGVDEAELEEADRALRPGGRLLVVHDYGRDEVSGLADPEAPEYVGWGRRDGPFLRDGGFKIHVVHCFWTFASIEDGRAFLVEAFGSRGEAVAAAMKRPRLTWNVAVYHRWRGGVAPEEVGATAGRARG